ncbi:MAG: HypC/HybG/HupF family hydrogenase formation chaperone [Acidimicrobiales bacterium]|jgi:hydrogenase maturation factor
MSRFHRVVGISVDARVTVRDLDGREQTVSLIAYEGPTPEIGDWLVAHSGFALVPADPAEAHAALSELQVLGGEERR